MIARRRLPRPTAPSTQTPSSSGPRWAITRGHGRDDRPRRPGRRSGSTAPAMPHTALREQVEDRAQLAHDRRLLVVGHLREERQREREPVGEDAAREVLGLEVVLVGVEAREDRRVRALARRDAARSRARAISALRCSLQPVDVVDRRLLRPEQADVRLVAVDAAGRDDRRLQPARGPRSRRRRCAARRAALVEDPVGRSICTSPARPGCRSCRKLKPRWL